MTEQLIQTGQLGLGYRKSEENHIGLAAMSAPMLFTGPQFTVPQTIDPRGILFGEYQGPMGSCAGHAMSHIGQWLNYLKTGQRQRISRMYCYLTGQRHGNLIGSDCGAVIKDVVDAGKTDGLPREETFPYPDPVHYFTQIPEAAYTEGRQHLLIGNISVMRSYADCQLWLGNGLGGLDIGIDWLQGLANFVGQRIELSTLTGGTLGGHSLAIICLSDQLDHAGRNYVWLRNSHGPGWGWGGWALVAPDVVDHWIQSGAAFIGVSDMEQYTPRAIPVAWMA